MCRAAARLKITPGAPMGLVVVHVGLPPERFQWLR